MTKTALITGITGQDGSYLAEFLLRKGYRVHGLVRRSSTFNTSRIDHIYCDPHEEDPRLQLHFGDLNDGNTVRRLLDDVHPDEFYNLGAQSHVRASFDMPLYTCDVGAMGTMRVLEAIRDYEKCHSRTIRFYQASSSEMFGDVQEIPQRETTPFKPRSPYAVGKVFSHHATVNYREAFGMHASTGILFNHESPRRGETFVTRKITRAVGRIKVGLQEQLFLGNLDAKRDWGFAGDYVEAMWLMLQQDEPDDYVVATGSTYSVREFAERAFSQVGLNFEDYVQFDSKYLRPTEVDILIGDPSKARERLGWQPKTSFEDLVSMMVEADVRIAERERLLSDAGYQLDKQVA